LILFYFIVIIFSKIEITYASAPNPTRGRPIHMGGDPKGKNFLYVNGGAVFIRDLKVKLIFNKINFQQTKFS